MSQLRVLFVHKSHHEVFELTHLYAVDFEARLNGVISSSSNPKYAKSCGCSGYRIVGSEKGLPVGAAEAGIVEILGCHVSAGPLIESGSSGAYGTSRHCLPSARLPTRDTDMMEVMWVTKLSLKS